MPRLLTVAILTAAGAGSQALLVFLLYWIVPDAGSGSALGVHLAGSFAMAFLLEYTLRTLMVTRSLRAQFVLGFLAGCAAYAVLRPERQDLIRGLTSGSAVVNGALVVAGVLIAGALGAAASRRLTDERN